MKKLKIIKKVIGYIDTNGFYLELEDKSFISCNMKIYHSVNIGDEVEIEVNLVRTIRESII